MKSKRRKFLQLAGTLGAGTLILPHLACSRKYSASQTAAITEGANNKLEEFGIQLYTIRDVINDDPKGYLKQLASFGYKQIESYEGPEGIFWGLGNKGMKSYLDDLGMKMVSSHCDIHKDFETKAAQAAEIGMAYLICPWVGPQPNMEAWKKITDKFNECGAICKKHGIRFAYHNHDYSFRAFSGMIAHDFIMKNTDPELVDHEMDIYWVVTGGADPIEYLKKYPNRFRLVHVKDRIRGVPADKTATCDLGTGMIDFPAILKVAIENGTKYFIAEQERYDNSTPIESAAANAEYLKNLVLR